MRRWGRGGVAVAAGILLALAAPTMAHADAPLPRCSAMTLVFSRVRPVS